MNHNRLIWACRRGMLELDLILQRFLEEAYPGLNEPDRVRFQALLEAEDQDLFGWLLRRQEPSDKATLRAVTLIREHCERPR
jgi:antitoxin CptB